MMIEKNAKGSLLRCFFFLCTFKADELTFYIDAVQESITAIHVLAAIAAWSDKLTHLAVLPRICTWLLSSIVQAQRHAGQYYSRNAGPMHTGQPARGTFLAYNHKNG